MRSGKLRIAWSVGCGIVCLLLIVLWVRSYPHVEDIRGKLARIAFSVASGRARLAARITMVPSPESGLSFKVNSKLNNNIKGYDADLTELENKLGFGFSRYVIVPYWFAAFIAVALSAMPWLRWTKHFSLRTLLIATTLIAVVLGLIVAVLRWSVG